MQIRSNKLIKVTISEKKRRDLIEIIQENNKKPTERVPKLTRKRG